MSTTLNLKSNTKRQPSAQQPRQASIVKIQSNKRTSNLVYGIGNVYTMPRMPCTDDVTNLNH
jgi:hypothetical protein